MAPRRPIRYLGQEGRYFGSPWRYRGPIRAGQHRPSVGVMRKIVELLGVVLLAMGVSGTIDHLAVQPILGFLNVLNRFVFPKVVPGYELYANLTVAVLGLALIVATSR